MRRLLDFLRRGLIRPDPRHAQGKRAEAQGLRLLRAQGLRLLARNRHGELDLIMLDGEVLVVVEVRWRSGSAFGGAAASIGPAKQARLARAAACWL
ncbi:YraN family protein, partial [Bordetella avium]